MLSLMFLKSHSKVKHQWYSGKSAWWTVLDSHHSSGNGDFHIALKLKSTRWRRPIFEYLRNENDDAVHFSSNNCGYLWAYESVLHSPVQQNLKDVKSPISKKHQKLQKIIENNGNFLPALLEVHSQDQSAYSWLFPNRGKWKVCQICTSPRYLVYLIDTTWKLNKAPEKKNARKGENGGCYGFCLKKVCGEMQFSMVLVYQRYVNPLTANVPII